MMSHQNRYYASDQCRLQPTLVLRRRETVLVARESGNANVNVNAKIIEEDEDCVLATVGSLGGGRTICILSQSKEGRCFDRDRGGVRGSAAGLDWW
jgi:hypothetical protein